MNKKILIAWWGALENGGETVGDLLSVQAICNALDKLDLQYDVSTRVTYPSLKNPIDWENVDPFHYNKLVFICGPISYEKASFCRLLKKFQHCTKIALGVSGLKNNTQDPHLTFDKVLSRDGFQGQTNNVDLSINQLFYEPVKFLSSRNQLNNPVLGLCLRGMQREYGIENCLSEHINLLLNKVQGHFNFQIKHIDTKLNQIYQDPLKIYNEFGLCDLIITTRLHGSLLSLAKGIPFLAIDQIKSGAKVSQQLALVGWPFTILANDLTEDILIRSIQTLLSRKYSREELEICRSKAFTKAAESLSKSIQLITNTEN